MHATFAGMYVVSSYPPDSSMCFLLDKLSSTSLLPLVGCEIVNSYFAAIWCRLDLVNILVFSFKFIVDLIHALFFCPHIWMFASMGSVSIL
jgi:hypothetical protein